MRVKLKTWDQLEKELKPIALKWKYNNSREGDVSIEFENFGWLMGKDFRKKYFGEEILDAEPCSINPNFTHYTRKHNIYLHELWFKQKDFLTEDDFEI